MANKRQHFQRMLDILEDYYLKENPDELPPEEKTELRDTISRHRNLDGFAGTSDREYLTSLLEDIGN